MTPAYGTAEYGAHMPEKWASLRSVGALRSYSLPSLEREHASESASTCKFLANNEIPPLETGSVRIARGGKQPLLDVSTIGIFLSTPFYRSTTLCANFGNVFKENLKNYSLLEKKEVSHIGAYFSGHPSSGSPRYIPCPGRSFRGIICISK